MFQMKAESFFVGLFPEVRGSGRKTLVLIETIFVLSTVGFGYGVVLGCSGTVLFQQTNSSQSYHKKYIYKKKRYRFSIKNNKLPKSNTIMQN